MTVGIVWKAIPVRKKSSKKKYFLAQLSNDPAVLELLQEASMCSIEEFDKGTIVNSDIDDEEESDTSDRERELWGPMSIRNMYLG